MSFIFNQMDFDEMFPTSEALRFEWEHLSGLGVESLEVPGMERRRFLETDRPRTKVEYTIILHSATEQGVEDALDQFMIHIDPSNGPQRLIDKDYPEWYQMAAVSEEVIWERLTWDCATRGYRYQGVVIFETYGDASQRRVDEDEPIVIDGPTSIDLDGNTRSWPTIEVSGPVKSAEVLRIRVNRTTHPDFTVEITGPIAANEKARLDYGNMEFGVWRGETKTASLVNRMSTLDRLELHQLDDITVGVMRIGPVPEKVLRRSLAVDPIASWTASGVVVSAVDGGWTRLVASGSSGYISSRPPYETTIPVVSGESYTQGIEVRVPEGMAAVEVESATFIYLEAGGESIQNRVSSGRITINPGSTTTLISNFAPPAGEGGARAILYLRSSGTVDVRMVYIGPAGAPFNGDTAPNGDKRYRWLPDGTSEEYLLPEDEGEIPVSGAVIYPNSRRQ